MAMTRFISWSEIGSVISLLDPFGTGGKNPRLTRQFLLWSGIDVNTLKRHPKIEEFIRITSTTTEGTVAFR